MPFPGYYDPTDSGRQPTSKLFRHFNPAAMHNNPGLGFLVYEDFLNLPGGYTLTQASQGTFALGLAVEEFGVALLDSGSSTDSQGPNLQFTGQAVTPAASTKIGFEARFKVVDTGATANTTTGNIFVGMASINTAVIASSAVAVTDWIGFYSVTDDGVLLGGADDGTESLFTTPGTATEDTYHKVGFLIDGLDSMEFYFDGEEFTQTVALTSIPDTLICPSFVMQSVGTTDPVMHLDSYCIGVLSGT
jgi:hypothetical protein